MTGLLIFLSLGSAIIVTCCVGVWNENAKKRFEVCYHYYGHCNLCWFRSREEAIKFAEIQIKDLDHTDPSYIRFITLKDTFVSENKEYLKNNPTNVIPLIERDEQGHILNIRYVPNEK